ncbi:MAG: choice-of-anchor A family protein [Phycisphaerae bacterium]
MSYLSRALVALTLLAAVTCANADTLNEWNLIVRHDLVTSSEVDGSAMIGGNLSGTSNYAIHGVTAFNGDGLVVGGDITGGTVQVNNGGNLRIGGAVQSGATVLLNGGGAQIDDLTTPAMISAAFAHVEAISAVFASLTANGTLDGAGNMTATPTVMDGQSVAVYNLSNDDFQNLGQLNLVMGSADTVIINVTSSGGVVDFRAPPNIIGGFNQNNSSRILWNLPDATSVLVNNSFNGALLAPFADLDLQGGGMNGTVVVDSISHMNAEVRQFTYTGYVPEPASLGLLGAGGLLVLRRR